MSSFLCLKNIIVNTRYITRISIRQDKYNIVLHTPPQGAIVFGSGMLEHEQTLEINREDQKEDYESVSKWIKSL